MKEETKDGLMKPLQKLHEKAANVLEKSRVFKTRSKYLITQLMRPAEKVTVCQEECTAQLKRNLRQSRQSKRRIEQELKIEFQILSDAIESVKSMVQNK